MERNRKSIQDLMEKTIILLSENDENEWAEFSKKLMAEYVDLNTRGDAVKSILNIYKGGMGSFTDLVSQKNMKMLVEENEWLASLKHELYNLCLSYCINHGIKV